jgi:uncharacterized protein YbgA (DUF1722 family)
MRHKICTAVWALLIITCGSGIVMSQLSGSFDADKEFNQAFYAELQTSEDELMQFGNSLQPLFEDMVRNAQGKVMTAVMERMKDTSSPPNPEEMMKLGMGVMIDEMIGMQKPVNEKATEFFSEDSLQKMHLRMFQLKEGIMENLGATDNEEIIQGAFGFEMLQLMGGHPDFLELSPEQHDLITKQQKETSVELLTLTTQASMKMMTENPEKLRQMMQLAGDIGKAQTDEEREEITKKIQEINKDMMKDALPEMKKLLIKGHENFHRALTDAQRAKIKAVMADMPEYMKKLLAEADKVGGVLSGLESWVPGAGVPGVNPNREAPRQRPQRERAFPGN